MTVGTTPGASTIQDAVNLIPQVGTVEVPANTYTEQITIENKIITIRPVGTDIVKLNAISTTTAIFIIRASTVALVDLEIGLNNDLPG